MSDKRFRLLFSAGVILLFALGTLVIISLILAFLGADVGKTLNCIFIYPFTSIKNLSNVINVMTPLAFVGVGICVAYRSGFINIGGEGQMTAGIMLSLLFGLNVTTLPRWLAIPCMLLVGAVGGAIWGAIPGFLKSRFRVSELLSTVMMNYIAAQFFAWFMRVPFADPTQAEPQTVKLVDTMWLKRINQIFTGMNKNLRFHTGILIAILLAVVIYLFLWKTPHGFRMRAAGASGRAARYAGINVGGYVILSMIISGALCGIAGTVEVLGVQHRGMANITGGYGFTGVVVALFGGLHPLGVIAASFVFAAIDYGCSAMQVNKIPLPSNTVNVLMGLIILVIVSVKTILGNAYLADRVRHKLFPERDKSGTKGGK